MIMHNICTNIYKQYHMFIRSIKIYFIIISISFVVSFNAWSAAILEGRQYIQLNHPISNAPELLEFFSFYCPHCYQFEKICNISNDVQKRLPKNVVFYKYHVNFLGNLGKQLTHAWAVAIALGVEDQIGPILFMAIQKYNSINSVEDIKTKFIQFGITSEQYDVAWNSILVKSLIMDQEQAAIKFKLKGVPAIFVHGKYMIRNDKLDISSIHAYIDQFFELLRLLMEK